MKKLIWLVLTVYLVIAPFTYHPDTKLVLYYPTLNGGKVWDIYTYLNTHQNDAPKFHYPPMNYWEQKAELPMVRLVGGNGIDNWLKSNGNQAFLDQKIYLYNLATKLPLILLVILTGWLIGQIMLKNGFKKRNADLAMLIWFFNPITIYSAIMMGQNDILAITPFVAGLWFYFDEPLIAFTLFGLAGSIKSFPLIWAGMLALAMPGKNLIKKIGFLMIPVIFYIVTMLPFLRMNYFRNDVLFSGLSMRMFDNTISLGGKIAIPITLIMLGILSIAVFFLKKKNNLSQLMVLLTATTLIILGFSNFNPQWMIWLIPFVAILGFRKQFYWFSVLTIAWLGVILLFNDKFLIWGILTPINPSLINLPTVNEFLINKLPVTLINNLCHGIIAALAIYWMYRYVKE